MRHEQNFWDFFLTKGKGLSLSKASSRLIPFNSVNHLHRNLVAFTLITESAFLSSDKRTTRYNTYRLNSIFKNKSREKLLTLKGSHKHRKRHRTRLPWYGYLKVDLKKKNHKITLIRAQCENALTIVGNMKFYRTEPKRIKIEKPVWKGGLLNTYPLDSHLSVGQRYLYFE